MGESKRKQKLLIAILFLSTAIYRKEEGCFLFFAA
jgi:hypothetical protein